MTRTSIRRQLPRSYAGIAVLTAFGLGLFMPIPIYIFFADRNLSDGWELAGYLLLSWLSASVFAVLLAAAAGWFVSRHLTLPLRNLTEVTRRMADGDLSARARIGRQDEIGELGASFNAMAERVEATVGTLRRFVADAAHELHTPLTALRGDLELAASDPDPARRQAFVERARTQLERLEGLIDDLLDLSRLEAAETQGSQECLDLASLVAELAEVHASRAEQAGLVFELELPAAPLTIRGDREQLRRALGNLLDNAVKFTPAGGRVRLALTRRGPWAALSVQDTGIGIPGEDLPGLFGRFRRARNASSYPGSGLGLAIVKAVLDRHGGRVAVENTFPGARFTLTWPLEVA